MTATISIALADLSSCASWNWLIGSAADLGFLSVRRSAQRERPEDFRGWLVPGRRGHCRFRPLSTWKRGREILFAKLHPGAIPLEPFIKSITEHPWLRVPGTAVFSRQPGRRTACPAAQPESQQGTARASSIAYGSFEDIPHVPDSQRIDVVPLGHDFFRVTVHYGFKDEPDLPEALKAASARAWSSDGNFILPVSANAGANAR